MQATYNNDPKMLKALDKHKVKCTCGHTMYILYDQLICKWCGRLNFKDKKAEFIYRTRKLRREK